MTTPLMTEVIATKRDGGTLSEAQIRAFIEGYTRGDVPDYQASALVMAIFLNGMEPDEFTTWTDAMLHSGDVLDLSDIPGVKVDKHSTGGVGDKVSLVLAPLVASAGVPVPMISGRGLGHTGGTLDKLESIPGFRTDLSVGRFRELVASLGCGLIGQTAEIAPADRKLYALRDATSTVPCIPLIASSIMSKKLAEGIDALVLDVKTGSGAFMQRLEDSRTLAQTMVRIGEGAGRRVRALITDMDAPLGECIGNALEVVESIEVLHGGGPADLRELTIELGAEMLVLGQVASDLDAARATLAAHLDDGRAAKRFAEIIEAQGGDPRVMDDTSLLPDAPTVAPFVAARSGYVTGFACAEVGRAAMVLGAGRATKEDRIDPGVGLIVHARRGDRVEAGQPLVEIRARDEATRAACVERLAASIHIGDTAPEVPPLVLERLGG